MIKRWKDLKFWESGEYQVIEERLNEHKNEYHPIKSKIFAAMDAVPFQRVRCAIVGQDPYPDASMATGLAFSIPSVYKEFNYPPTLVNILKEYVNDLGYPFPKSGNLETWCTQGVLLWNVIPVHIRNKPLWYSNWLEWSFLNKEMFSELEKKKDVCFVFLGSVARQYAIDLSFDTMVIQTSHPSPRGSINSKLPFLGSRVFTHVNDKLVENGLSPIDWRL
jgi:uracil-DNA glycosylase